MFFQVSLEHIKAHLSFSDHGWQTAKKKRAQFDRVFDVSYLSEPVELTQIQSITYLIQHHDHMFLN